MNSFGRLFRVTIWGESHAAQIGITIDGVKAGIPLDESDFTCDLSRRQGGSQRGTTPRRESDTPHIVSGLFNGYTTGSPLTITFENNNTISKDYSSLQNHPRPSHADRVASVKYNNYNDYRGGGHFSGRLTLAITAAGVVAKKMLGENVLIHSNIKNIGTESDPAKFEQAIEQAISNHDSVGGVIECSAKGLPTGLGEPLFDSAESLISHIVFSIPAVKGIEFGAGFAIAAMNGSTSNDMIIDERGTTATNNAGGIDGGITNGNELLLRVAIKPTPSIAREQMTYNSSSKEVEALSIKGRHDACIALRAAVVVEAAVAIALADMSLIAKSQDIR